LALVQRRRGRNCFAIRDHDIQELSRLDSQQLQSALATGSPFYLFVILGTGSALLQLYNIAMLNAFWAFFTAIVLHLLGAMFQFARIILLPPGA
jgi:hypothetical protein